MAVEELVSPAPVTNERSSAVVSLEDKYTALGGRIYLSRAIVVHYLPRSSFRALARQYFRYGKGRARTALKHHRLPTLRPLLPFGLVVGGALLVATARWQPFTRWVAAAYATVCLVEAVRVSRLGTPEPATVPVIAAIFPVMHVCHGVGFATGLLRYGLRPDWASTHAALAAS